MKATQLNFIDKVSQQKKVEGLTLNLNVEKNFFLCFDIDHITKVFWSWSLLNHFKPMNRAL